MSRGKRIPVVAAIDKVVCIVLNEAWIIVLICRQTIGQRNQLQRYATPECIIADFSYGERNCNGLQPAAVRKGAVADGLQADGQGASANDAASVIAWDVGGSLNAFIQQMNARAAELGCTSATFTCAHGLYDYGNVASAEDMAKIAAACAANETFAQVAGSTTYTLGQTNFHSEQRTISSSNPLMDASGAYYKDSVKWVKGGFTTLAGRCAVALAQKDGHTYGLVILGSDSNEHLYSECDDLFDWAFASFADRPLVDTKTVVTTVDLTKCRTHPEVELYAAAPVSGYGHADDKVSYSFDLPESVSATVKNGQKLGTATVYLDGCEVGQVDLVTHQEYVSDFRTDSWSTLLLLAALAVILLVLSVVTLACGGGSRSLNRRRRMKRRR